MIRFSQISVSEKYLYWHCGRRTGMLSFLSNELQRVKSYRIKILTENLNSSFFSLIFQVLFKF